MKPKVATYNEPGWAIGRIHKGLGKELSDEYDFVHYDWSNPQHRKELWGDGGWKNYDILLGNGTLSAIEGLPPEAYEKMICAIWAIPNLSSHFKEVIVHREGIDWACVGDDLEEWLLVNEGIKASQVTGGTSEDEFYPTRKITKIKNLGLNGLPFVNPGWDRIKRPQMLINIAKGIGGNAVFIHDKDISEGQSMYDDIDMYVCTSVNDRGPGGIAEAAFCKIPVISTKTGHGLRFKSIKTFDTIEQAIEIINELNSSEEILEKYINDVHEEITQAMNWKFIADTYWRPLFSKKLSLNK